MIVSDVREIEVDGDRELSATVTFGARDPETHRIWIRRPVAGPSPPGMADPLFATLLVSAMALHEELVIEAPVSTTLVDAATTCVVPQLLAWHPRLRESRLELERVADGPPADPNAGTASLFSLGVDSWHTLLRHEDEIATIVYIRGFEIRDHHEALGAAVLEGIREVADERGVALLSPHTNFLTVALLAVTDRLGREGRPWRDLGVDAWYGSMLVAVGLALRPDLGRLIVPGSWSRHVDYPVASHPLMEPAWSTPSMGFELDAFDDTRITKVRNLVRTAPEVLPHLRVCIDTSGTVHDRLNCGRCIKCVRLMMELKVSGVDDVDRLRLFAHPVDVRRWMRRRFHADPVLWGELRDAADEAGETGIADAIRVMLDEKPYLPRLARDLTRVVRKRSWSEMRWPRRPKR